MSDTIEISLSIIEDPISISLSIEESPIEIGLVAPPTLYTGATTITENGTVPTEGKYLEDDLTIAVPLPPSYEGATTITENGTVPTEGKYLETNLIVNVPTVGVGNKVRFIDFNGTILSTQYIPNGNNATPPVVPTHTGLTFQEWNASYENITADKDIGATYTTSDGKTHLHIRLTTVTGLQPPICLYNNDANSIWLNLGDGSADIELTGTGAISYTPTYAAAGDYDITVWKTTGTFGLGGNSNSTSVIGGNIDAYRQTLIYVNTGNNCNALKFDAFYRCTSLHKISLSISISEIRTQTFLECVSILSVIIPNSVTTLGGGCFQNCSSLTSITIPSSVTSIGGNAFLNCSSLTSITIPSGVTSIESYTFQNCYSLTSITIPSGVTSIGDSVFYNCYSLTSITIPSGVTSIGTSAFYNCYSLTSITIPSNVTSIGASAFRACYSLTSITIPSGVTSIGSSAFQNCYSIVEYHILATTPPTLVSTNTFTGINAICKIYVPMASVDAYKAATNWSAYANYIYGE